MERSGIEQRTQRILTDLERVRENLLALSDDIWLSVNHNDSDAVRQGADFKVAYNEKLAEFDRVAAGLSTLVQQFTGVAVEQEAAPASTDHAAQAEHNQRIIAELDRTEPHGLNEDFCYKRPYGFVIEGTAFSDLVTWRRAYELFCEYLHQKDPARFGQLPANPLFLTNRGNSAFARSADSLRSAMPVGGIFAEANLSANGIRDKIRQLLEVFRIPESEMRIYLREDRDAG